MDPRGWLGREVEVLVEAPRFSFVKRGAGGEVDLVSPVPVPWNYGCVPSERGGDGDALDAILLGPRRPAGWTGRVPVVGVVLFVDGGAEDTKLVCGRPGPLTRWGVRVFFAVYAPFKRALRRARGMPGETVVRGIVWSSPLRSGERLE